MFNFNSSCQSFQCNYTILYSHEQSVWILVALHPCQCLVLSVFKILVILLYVRSSHFSFIVSFICISLMLISLSIFKNVLSDYFSIFCEVFGLLVFLLLSFRSTFYFWIQVLWNVNISSQSVTYLFILFQWSFVEHQLMVWERVKCGPSILFFWSIYLPL